MTEVSFTGIVHKNAISSPLADKVVPLPNYMRVWWGHFCSTLAFKTEYIAFIVSAKWLSERSFSFIHGSEQEVRAKHIEELVSLFENSQ